MKFRDWCCRFAPVSVLVCTVAMAAGYVDPRLRIVPYSADEIYRLPGYVGYQIDLEFDPGERFVGLGAGDLDGLVFTAQMNHLFIKPKASNVSTNLTVLTNLRIYHFDYATLPRPPDPDHTDIIYALRFSYPTSPATAVASAHADSAQAVLAQTRSTDSRNSDYWYCGRPELRPIEAWDDGVHTHLRFGARTELPAVFVRNDDGSESLLNFDVEHDEVVVHRIARRFVLRRGKLTGCIVNKGFGGSGASLPSGTLSPQINRVLREPGQ